MVGCKSCGCVLSLSLLLVIVIMVLPITSSFFIFHFFSLHFQDSHSKNGSLLVFKMSICLKSVWCLMSVTTFWKEDLLNLTNFGAVYLTQFLTDCSQILDSKSYDQA